MKLPVFAKVKNGELVSLSSPVVKKVIHFALGPAGTNIEQACKAWTTKNDICAKTEIILCQTPENSLKQARMILENGVLPIFWTCAVYSKENEFFFGNPDVFPFLFQHSMPLDTMQLCIQPEMKEQEWDDSKWRIASHPSPAPLVHNLGNVVLTTSNSQAAILCANGEVEACITTAQAAKIHKLATVHEFGSPIMVFFGGTTQHGMDILLGQ